MQYFILKIFKKQVRFEYSVIFINKYKIMERTKKVTITLDKETIKKLDKHIKDNSINKSALIDRLINNEIDKKNQTT